MSFRILHTMHFTVSLSKRVWGGGERVVEHVRVSVMVTRDPENLEIRISNT